MEILMDNDAFQDKAGRWFKKNTHRLGDLLETIKKEEIEQLGTPPDEKERFLWRGSLVMVKHGGSIQINNIDEEKIEFLNQFKLDNSKQIRLF